MSLAWASAAFALVMIPGLLFWIGMFYPENFSRDVTSRSPLIEAISIIAISAGIHWALFLLYLLLCQFGVVRCPDVTISMTFLQFPGLQSDIEVVRLVASLRQDAVPITCHFVFAAGIGLALGISWGNAIVRGWLFGVPRRLAGHPWIHNLHSSDTETEIFTFAYVMTHTNLEDKVLMYQGPLLSFGLKPDGCFAYIIISPCERLFMRFDDQLSTMPEPLRIGLTRSEGSPSVTWETEGDMFIIEGDDVANVVFSAEQTEAFVIDPDGIEALSASPTTVELESGGVADESPKTD